MNVSHRRPGRLALAGGLALSLGLAGMAAAWASAWASGPNGPGQVEIPIRYSQFEQSRVIVRAGMPVTFVIVNGDPIDHEWIVGDAGVHERHRQGKEPVHASGPTEVSVAAGTTEATTVTFTRPGTYLFICHLPGHEAYGMVGTVTVTD